MPCKDKNKYFYGPVEKWSGSDIARLAGAYYYMTDGGLLLLFRRLLSELISKNELLSLDFYNLAASAVVTGSFAGWKEFFNAGGALLF